MKAANQIETKTLLEGNKVTVVCEAVGSRRCQRCQRWRVDYKRASQLGVLYV